MLKIKENVDLKELEKFGFKKEVEKHATYKYECKNGEEDYFTETLYRYDDGINTIEIVEKRENSDWKHLNQERELYVFESDYDCGVSESMLSVLYDLIQAGLVEKL